MSCHDLEEAIVEVGRGREVGRGTAAAVEAHIGHCEPCAGKLARERQVSSELRALAAATAGDVPSALLDRQLREAFAAHHRAPASRRWLGATAAAVAAAAVFGWWQVTRIQPGHSPADPGREARASTPPVATPPTAARPGAGSGAREPRPAPPAAASPPRSTRSPVARVGAEDAGFVALAVAQGLPEFESGVIVRMEMPTAALPAYGIEIVQDTKAPVEADLLIGQDGQARAIRLVTRASRVVVKPNVKPGAEQQ